MAAVGPTRQSRVSMSVSSMSLVQGGQAAAGAATGTVLGMLSLLLVRKLSELITSIVFPAAAAPYYQAPNIPQDVQQDRPIGYGAFGVVW